MQCAAWCFNRTFLVLKSSVAASSAQAARRFNRTFLVLKLIRMMSRDTASVPRFNRTFLVLKWKYESG